MSDAMHLSLLVPMPDRAYRVDIGRGVRSLLSERIKSLGASSLIIVHDDKLSAHARELQEQQSLPCTLIAIAGGEASKSFQGLESIADVAFAGDVKPDRQTIVVALGGGVVGDLAGFFASILLRGVRVIHLPSTLLAMVDSAIGGKTAINHARAKNQLGTFHQPSAVLADCELLDSLPDDDYRAALSEVVKYGVVLDEKLFSFLEEQHAEINARNADVLCQVIAACARDKARVVVQDERESGVRRVLNYGHTLGHAIEQASGYALRHGEAVAIGMHWAARYGESIGVTASEVVARQEGLLKALGMSLDLPRGLQERAILAALAQDKKRAASSFPIVLPREAGRWALHDAGTSGAFFEALHRLGLSLD